MIYEVIQKAVLDGKPRLVEKSIKEALWKGLDPEEILKKGLLSSLDSLEGNLCQEEEQIAMTLACARAMKRGIECLESELGDKLPKQKCSVLIGTAAGDLHDMGKNIVALYFRIAGFPVIDLGVDVSAEQFLRTLEKHEEISILCVSSLLNTSLPEVRRIVQTVRSGLKQRKVFIMIGGGSLTAELAEEFGADCYTDNAISAARAAGTYANGL